MYNKFPIIFSLLCLLIAALPAFGDELPAPHGFKVYAWQNWSFEAVDTNDRNYTRISNNAANIGFTSIVATGIKGLQVGFRCEQFTFFNNLNDSTNLCNRNSKISLMHENLGEIMFAQWLLPFNEVVAQWVDPFYDAGADSHSSLMGNFGYGAQSYFYNGGFADFNTENADFGQMSFNRRQQDIIQYVWPNTVAMASQTREGLQLRAAITSGRDNDTLVGDPTTESRRIDPYILSLGTSYQLNTGSDGILWFAAAYETHEDWTVGKVSAIVALPSNYSLTGLDGCLRSDDRAYRLAARLVQDWDDGTATTVAGMWENAEWELGQCGPTASYNSAQVEKSTWMLSGKHNFGNGFDIRASYLIADDLELDLVGNTGGSPSFNGDLPHSDAEAYNLGVFYTTSKGTELRLTYSEVDNGAGSAYDFGINGASYNGIVPGEDIQMLAIGLVQWFE